LPLGVFVLVLLVPVELLAPELLLPGEVAAPWLVLDRSVVEVEDEFVMLLRLLLLPRPVLY